MIGHVLSDMKGFTMELYVYANTARHNNTNDKEGYVIFI